MSDSEPTPRQKPLPKASPEPTTLLCVDDDELVLTFYQMALEQRGYRVLTCQEPPAVVPALLANPDIRLILLDLHLPDEDGLAILRRIQRDDRFSRIPVILVSADDREEMVTEGLSSGADDYLVKPLAGGELSAKVSMTLRRRHLAQVTARGLGGGDVIGNRYAIESKLGSGGFATVYLARDVINADAPPVAVKTFHGDRGADNDFVARFLREANAHCRLHHPNIVRMLDFGQRDNLYFLVMEYVEGMNLEQIAASTPQIDEGTTVFVALDILKALDYLRGHGLVHRDVKLRNILVTREGTSKLLDFGLTRRHNDETLSSTSELSGTPTYLSPEHIRASNTVDIRSDVYSLGITLYQLLAGRLPYPEASRLEVVHHHLQTPPIPIAELRPKLTPALAELVDSMLIKDRNHRPWPHELLARLAAMINEPEA